MTDKTIRAVFGSMRKVKTAPLWRFDYGIKLQPVGLNLPEYYETHFSNSRTGEAETVIADSTGAVIPAEFLIPGTEIYAWIFLVGDSYGRTRAEITIPVDAKARPIDQEPAPEQQSAIDQAIAALNEAGDRAEEAADAADSFNQESELHAVESKSRAVGGTGMREGEDQNNSKFWAMLAQQGAEESGYVWFDIDDQTGEMSVTITPNLDRDLKFQINENTGELEVIVYG